MFLTCFIVGLGLFVLICIVACNSITTYQLKKQGSKKEGDKRLQFDFSDDAVERLDAVVKTTGASSRAEVIRNALRLYDYTVNKIQDGYDLNFIKSGEEGDIRVPGTFVN